MHKPVVSFAVVLFSGAMAFAQQMPAPTNADDMKWGAAPNVFPPGAQIAVVSGDPFKEGLYVVRLKMPAGYKIPAHNHPTTEYVTVLSGVFNIGMGDKLDPAKSAALKSSLANYSWSRSVVSAAARYASKSSGLTPSEISAAAAGSDLFDTTAAHAA